MTREQLADRFEEATGRPIDAGTSRDRCCGQYRSPCATSSLQAPLMALALDADLQEEPLSPESLRSLGIEPRPVGAYVDELAASA